MQSSRRVFDIGNVCDPELVWGTNIKPPVESGVQDDRGIITILARTFTANLGLDACQSH